MTPVHGTETSEGRLGAVLRSRGLTGPVRLGRLGPWLATTLADARTVLTTPDDFDFPTDVSRKPMRETRQTDTPQRSPHPITPPVAADRVAVGRDVFTEELAAATSGVGGFDVDAMRLLREPVARSTVAALLPDVDHEARDEVGDLVLAWIDALGPVIASRWGPGRLSPARRREDRARLALQTALAHVGCDDPAATATVLAAGIQVPIAAGAWLLVELASAPGVVEALRADESLVAGVVWETLRLCPPTWITARVSTRDVPLGSETIPEGSVVLVSPLLLGRDPGLVPGPERGRSPLDEFSPQRWARDDVRPGAWLPFGAGPHACPGRNLGIAQLTSLATWAAGREWELAGPVRVNQDRGIFPDPARLRFSA